MADEVKQTEAAPAAAPAAVAPAVAPVTAAAPVVPAAAPAVQLGGEAAAAPVAPVVGADSKPVAAAAAPAEAEFKVALPEGIDAKSPEVAAALTNITTLAKAEGVSAKAASAFAVAYFADRKAASESLAAGQKAQLEALRSDPDIGGAKLEASLKAANGVMAKYPAGTEALKAIASMGLATHPAVVKLFAQIGNSLREDSIAGASNGANGATAAQADAKYLADFYPNTKFAG